MAEFEKIRFSQFDQVRLLTTKNVKYLSQPTGTTVSPHGIWTIAAAVEGDELLVTKEGAIIRIPISDVLKVAEHKLDQILSTLGRLTNG
jgi:hypothetical protein